MSRSRMWILALMTLLALLPVAAGCRNASDNGPWQEDPASVRVAAHRTQLIKNVAAIYVGGLGANEPYWYSSYMSSEATPVAALRARAFGRYVDTDPRVVAVHLAPVPSPQSGADHVDWQADLVVAPKLGKGSPQFHVLASGKVDLQQDTVTVTDAVLVP